MPVIALIGNPNCGKTTLFNALAGASAATGNWPGVTIEKREGSMQAGGMRVTVVDLPGAYSLTPYTAEEAVTRDFLAAGNADLIVNVLNPMFLSRELYLTLELTALDKPVICVLNKADEMEQNDVSVNPVRLGDALGAPVVCVSAKKSTGLDDLAGQIAKLLSEPHPPVHAASYASMHTRIQEILTECGYSVPDNRHFRLTDRLDRIMLGKYTAFPFLLIVMAFLFYTAFGTPGRLLTYAADRIFQGLASIAGPLLKALPVWMDSLVRNGIFTGAFSVLAFLPQVAVLYFFTAFVEESGYMARAAFITDKLFRKIGLSGRSAIYMIMGLGCTTTAITAARGLDSERDRKMTIMLTPFISCGAKMPVYALIASECYGRLAPFAVMGVYITGFLALSVSGAILNRLLNRKIPSDFLLELPPYRMPQAGEILKRSLAHISEFAKRAGTVIVLASTASWFLTYYSPSLTPAVNEEASILACAAKSVSSLFRPLGFGSWQAVSALLSGIFAKESIIATLRILSPDSVSMLFRGHNAFSYLVFISLSPPCVCALSGIRRELGTAKLFLITVFMQLLWAIAAAMLINIF